jgi:hypothetical protein
MYNMDSNEGLANWTETIFKTLQYLPEPIKSKIIVSDCMYGAMQIRAPKPTDLHPVACASNSSILEGPSSLSQPNPIFSKTTH